MPPTTVIVIAARDEAQRIPATLAALAEAFPGAPIVVGDDGSRDDTVNLARAAGATVCSTGRRRGKGAAATLAARHALELGGESAVYVLCDADLGRSAATLVALAEAVRTGDASVAVASFARRRGGGFGIALGFARWALHRRTGLRLSSPMSGQRALGGGALRAVLPFAPRFGMELAMGIDASQAGLPITELELELEHRATGRDRRGFRHRGRQLGDLLAVYLVHGRGGGHRLRQ